MRVCVDTTLPLDILKNEFKGILPMIKKEKASGEPDKFRRLHKERSKKDDVGITTFLFYIEQCAMNVKGEGGWHARRDSNPRPTD